MDLNSSKVSKESPLEVESIVVNTMGFRVRGGWVQESVWFCNPRFMTLPF